MKRKPKKYMYGKFHHDTAEFHRVLYDMFGNFLSNHSLDMKTNNDIVDLRNKTVALLDSWISSKKFETKFGIKLPLHTTPTSIKNFLEKMARSRNRIYKPCEICGEGRITHYCHIIPRAEGGPNDESNYLYLCPLHHHLFDDNRLTKEEWAKINFSDKLLAAQEYASKIRLLLNKKNW